jgi:hypothetical protein
VRSIDELKIEHAVLLFLRRIDRGEPRRQKLSRREQDRRAEIAWKLVEDLKVVVGHATAVSASLAREQVAAKEPSATE